MFGGRSAAYPQADTPTTRQVFGADYRGNKMTAYENLKRKEQILSGASLRARAPDMIVLWFERSRELRKKAKEMTIEEAENEELF